MYDTDIQFESVKIGDKVFIKIIMDFELCKMNCGNIEISPAVQREQEGAETSTEEKEDAGDEIPMKPLTEVFGELLEAE